ncbi:uncharacterized protein LOC110069640 [Orbicella faveolata]|uniref:uncharacterized protein LOC110069640 n=1 Tax=Orbicella faveolata TaxID=48498 RepID=UPI0009E4FC88|nr:uncharacterized protein LOC110069640 [Orbicella faveolata]
MRFVSFYTGFDETMMTRPRFSYSFVFLMFISIVRGITQCPAQGIFKSYTCPRFFDPAERTRCCFWNGPACCLPGGTTCRDNAASVRNYCPGPNDGKNDKVCCTINNEGKCCSVGLLAAILGGVFGFVVLVLLVVFCVCWFSSRCPLNNYRSRRRQMQNTAAAPPPTVFPRWPPGNN